MDNNITSKLKYKEPVVKFSYKYGVTNMQQLIFKEAFLCVKKTKISMYGRWKSVNPLMNGGALT